MRLITDMNQSTLPFKDKIGDNSTFRALHYLGGKSRIVEPLKKILDEINESGGICDLFAGSGAVSQVFRNERKVIANDVQEYSRVICSALLNPMSLLKIESVKQSDFIDETVLENAFITFEQLIRLEEEILQNQRFSLEEAAQFIEGSSIYRRLNNELPKNTFSQLEKAMDQCLSILSNSQTNKFLITKYFGGIFFSFKQSCYLDAILSEVQQVEKKYYDTHLAALLSCTSNIVNSVGKQFAQPINPRNRSGLPKRNLIRSLNKDRNLDVIEHYTSSLLKFLNRKSNQAFQHKAVKYDFREAINNLPEGIKFIYADPPYTRDHYSRFYHVLETICLNDYPIVSKNKAKGVTNFSKGLYREKRHQSEFCIRSQAPKAFIDLFELSKKKNKVLILSYSPYDEGKGAHPRVVKLEFLQNTAKQYFDVVEIVSAGKFRHSKLNRTDFHLNSEHEAEVFLVCKNYNN